MNSEGGSAWTSANSTPVNRLDEERVSHCTVHAFTRGSKLHSPQFLSFVQQGHPSVHRLHSKHLVVALLVVEHA